ncbi:MAG: response regulator, partial [Vicinamibacterales bacterium]
HPPPVAHDRRVRVLLADDHETVREGLRFLVDAQPDMEVVGEAASGQEAIEQAQSLAPDVIILDLTMPGLSGLAAAPGIRTAAPAAAVVVLTRHDDDAFVQQLFESGVSAYVLKQSRSAELMRAIRIAASGGRYLDPSLPAPLSREPRRRLGTPRISDREVEVLRLVAAGHTNKDIASTLSITVKTVEVHKANAMRKLSLRGRTDVVRYALLNGWLGDV